MHLGRDCAAIFQWGIPQSEEEENIVHYWEDFTNWFEPPLVDPASDVQARWEKNFQGQMVGKSSYQPVYHHMLLITCLNFSSGDSVKL